MVKALLFNTEAAKNTEKTQRFRFLLFLVLLGLSSFVFAEPPLLSLEVEQTTLKWQDEFILTLSIYAPSDMELPPLTVDGLDQFKLQGTGKNLLQIPRGKTKRWILTYTLIASETGSFKIGPAILMVNGQAYRSNIVFLNIEGPPTRKTAIQTIPEPEEPAPKPAEKPKKENIAPQKEEKKPVAIPLKEEKKPAPTPQKEEKKPAVTQKEEKKPPVTPPKEEKKQPVAPPKEEKKAPVEEPKQEQKEVVKPPVVMSSAQIGDRILVLMSPGNSHPYRYQGVPVTVRLLSQLPVENLQFLEEADFPGFLRYDFPFTSKPKGEVVSFRNDYYASFELVKFLLFPLQDGEINIPPVRCELKVRVPSGAFPDADLHLTLERSSNSLSLKVKPTPEGAIVGDFSLRNQIVSDEPDSKIVRVTLEGKGQLSTFEFPEITGTQFLIRKLNGATNVKMEGGNLISKKTQDLEVLPQMSTMSIVLPSIRVPEFDPETGQLSTLKLPSLAFRFSPPGATQKIKPVFPEIGSSRLLAALLLLSMLAVGWLYWQKFRPAIPKTKLRLHRLFSNKNLKLQISKSAARKLYQQITSVVASRDGDSTTLIETLRKHLPREDWLSIDRGLRKLERTAYSSTRPTAITYEEMRKLCEKIEASWLP
jgi:hypothetical protein